MITRLLRRLQGRPAAAMTAGFETLPDIARVDDAAADDGADAMVIEPAVLTCAFVRHLLDTPPGAPVEDGLSEDILARLTAHAERLDVARLPRLPALVPQLLSTLRRDDSDANSLATLLTRDPTLAGAVVRVANSAHYRRGAQVTSLPQAIGVIGNDGLRYVVLTSVMRPILQADPSQQAARSGERLSRQAEARTWICGELAAASGCDAGEAQLASVIASAGVAALMRMMPRTLLAQAAADTSFAAAFMTLSATLSARAATHWRLDEGLQRALRSMAAPAPDDTALARALVAADRLSMLHALRVAGSIDELAQVSPDAGGRRRDARLLAMLHEMDVAPADG
jgi:HD-like signal output (HDOD) protein